MLIATLGPTSAGAGKTIVWNSTGDGQFVLVGAGRMSAAEVMRRDRAGQLVWASDETREWVASLAEASAPEPTSAAEAGMTQRIQSTLAGQAQALGRAVGATKSRLGKKADTDPAFQSTAASDPPTNDDQPAYESTPPTARGDAETTNGSPRTSAVLIATFNETTGWAGKTITFDDEQFILEDHGPILAEGVVEYGRQGHLVWANAGMLTWVEERANAGGAVSPGVPTPIRLSAEFPYRKDDVFDAILEAVPSVRRMTIVSSERPSGMVNVKVAGGSRHMGADVLISVGETAPGKTLVSIASTPKGIPVFGTVTSHHIDENRKDVDSIVLAMRQRLKFQPPVGSVAGLVATFGPTTAWADKTIVFEDGEFILKDHGPLSAADVMTYDGEGHLIWATIETRSWVGALSLMSAVAGMNGLPQTFLSSSQYEIWEAVHAELVAGPSSLNKPQREAKLHALKNLVSTGAITASEYEVLKTALAQQEGQGHSSASLGRFGRMYEQAQLVITQRLVAPATAKYPPLVADMIIFDGCSASEFIIDTHVDSQNRNSAFIRTNARAKFDAATDTLLGTSFFTDSFPPWQRMRWAPYILRS